MQKHVKVYFEFFNFGEQDYVPCEYCGGRAVDIHHLVRRSEGGQDIIENLAALCRTHHSEAHRNKDFNDQLKKIHERKINRRKRF